MNAASKVFGIFSRTSIVVQVHVENCLMLNRCTGRKYANLIRVEQDEIEDLRANGYKIRVCKCAK